ncbi:MAG: DinB family protein [Gemmatimonadales bacterium]
MRAGFAVRLGILDQAIDRVERRVAALAPDELRSPASGRWGPLAIVEHLVLVHEGTAHVLDRAGSAAPSDRQASWWRPGVLTFVLRSRIRIRAPTARILPSADPPPLQALTERWGAAQGSLRQSVAGKSRGWPDGLVFRHPLAGWLDVAETLQFLLDHIGHHERQLP